MEQKNLLTEKIGQTVYTVEVKTAEKSTASAVDVIKKVIKSEVMEGEFVA